jgi:hypothetical protein
MVEVSSILTLGIDRGERLYVDVVIIWRLDLIETLLASGLNLQGVTDRLVVLVSSWRGM